MEKAINNIENYNICYDLNESGKNCLAKKEFYKAISYFKEAININKDFFQAYNNLGICYKEIKQYTKAIIYFKKVIEINSNFAGAYNNLANLYQIQNSKKYKNLIIDNYNKAIKLSPDNIEFHINLGNFYLHKIHSYKLAIDSYNKGLKYFPNNFDLIIKLADAYAKDKLFSQALELLLTIETNSPMNSNFYKSIADLYSILNEHSTAIKYYKQAINLDNKIKYKFALMQGYARKYKNILTLFLMLYFIFTIALWLIWYKGGFYVD